MSSTRTLARWLRSLADRLDRSDVADAAVHDDLPPRAICFTAIGTDKLLQASRRHEPASSEDLDLASSTSFTSPGAEPPVGDGPSARALSFPAQRVGMGTGPRSVDHV